MLIKRYIHRYNQVSLLFPQYRQEIFSRTWNIKLTCFVIKNFSNISKSCFNPFNDVWVSAFNDIASKNLLARMKWFTDFTDKEICLKIWSKILKDFCYSKMFDFGNLITSIDAVSFVDMDIGRIMDRVGWTWHIVSDVLNWQSYHNNCKFFIKTLSHLFSHNKNLTNLYLIDILCCFKYHETIL